MRENGFASDVTITTLFFSLNHNKLLSKNYWGQFNLMTLYMEVTSLSVLAFHEIGGGQN